MTCGAEIKRYDLIPILSYLLLRGKCRNCGAKISPRYAIIEALTAVLFTLVFMRFDFLYYGFLYPAIVCLFLAATIVIAFEDLDTQTMSISVLLWISGFAAAATVLYLLPESIYRRSARLAELTGITLVDRIIGLFAVSVPFLLIGFVITPLVYRAVMKNKGEPVYGFGMGDIVLMAAAGLMLGVKGVVVGAFIGIIAGAVYGMILRRMENRNLEKTAKFAFGPFLCLGITVAVFYGNTLWDAYMSLF
jgi:leader peptidase (prepilin peptidase)/N-methyltransferase